MERNFRLLVFYKIETDMLTVEPSRFTHGHLYTGQLCRHFVFRQVDIMGAVCWDPSYTPGLDFLDHNF